MAISEDSALCSPSLPEHQRHVYVIGQSALEEELAALGLTWHGGTVGYRISLHESGADHAAA